MNIQEKARLVQKLTNEIVEELTSEEFAKKSAENKRVAGLVKVFKSHVVSHARLLSNWTKGVD